MRTILVLKEKAPKETRCAMVPKVIPELIKSVSAKVLVERGAGQRSGFSDQDYEDAGAELIDDISKGYEQAEIILCINGANIEFHDQLKSKIILGLFDPLNHKENVSKLKTQRNNVFSLEFLPRISRAQSMDILSSQANLAGYVATLIAAEKLPKILPMLMTAAGTIDPAKVLILGAGVAGLSAIATSKRLGALVYSYDVRSAVKEQVESLGGKFVSIKSASNAEDKGGYAKALSEDEQRAQRKELTNFAKDMDIIITTALIPGRKAPRLLDDFIFNDMKNGSVIIDLAAAAGGNIAHSKPGEWTEVEGVQVFGGNDLSRFVAKDASFCLAKNYSAFLQNLFASPKNEVSKAKNEINFDDEIVAETLLCKDGEWFSETFKNRLNVTGEKNG